MQISTSEQTASPQAPLAQKNAAHPRLSDDFRQLFIIDSNVPDYQQIIATLPPGAQVHILEPGSDGIGQISDILASQAKIGEVHIISHGSAGTLYLGNSTISDQNLDKYQEQLEQWKNHLDPDGDILLYGCDVGADSQFISKLHQFTGADIAASENKTGKGGDWELESHIGEIETQPLNVPNYSYTLAPTGTADNQGILVSGTPTSTKIDVLANDTGTGRVKVESIVTAPSNGTAIINDWIYVGGFFSNIGGQPRKGIARLNSDGTVDANFNPNAGVPSTPFNLDGIGEVYAIAIDSSGNPIVGGWFTTIGGQNRPYIAKLNPTDGTVDPTFNPDAGDVVKAIAIDSKGNPYVGGFFTTIGGQNRPYIAKLNPTNGTADPTFDPNADDSVKAIAIDSSDNPYVGGDFTNIGGETRLHIAKLNPTNGTADPTFDPNADDSVNAIAIGSDNPYVGGDFTDIGG